MGPYPAGRSTKLRADAGNLNAVCDGETDLLIPNYGIRPGFPSPLVADYQSYVSLIAGYFGCTYHPQGSGTLCRAVQGYSPSSVLYVRGGAGLGDEGATLSPGMDYYGAPVSNSAVTAQFGTWGFTPTAGETWQESMMTLYQTQFTSYAPVMYPISALDSCPTGTPSHDAPRTGTYG